MGQPDTENQLPDRVQLLNLKFDDVAKLLVEPYKEFSIAPQHLDRGFVAACRKRFLWKCDFEKWTFEVSYFFTFGFDRLQKVQNSLWENVWNSVRNYMEVIENILW